MIQIFVLLFTQMLFQMLRKNIQPFDDSKRI